jgi:hypothetical protein
MSLSKPELVAFAGLGTLIGVVLALFLSGNGNSQDKDDKIIGESIYLIDSDKSKIRDMSSGKCVGRSVPMRRTKTSIELGDTIDLMNENTDTVV